MTRQVQLIMVTENNNNKFYNMIEEGDHIRIEYGRVGAAVRTCTKPLSAWDSVYREKTGKGYKDITSLKGEVKIQGYKEISIPEVKYIVDKLVSRSRQAVANSYKVSYNQVTQTQLTEAQTIINDLVRNTQSSAISTWENSFNNSLIKLYTAIPRKMDNVKRHLMKPDSTLEDYQRKISQEQDLLDSLATQINQSNIPEGDADITILEAVGVNLVAASETDLEIIKEKLGDNARQFKKAWRVDNLKTLKQYQDSYESVGVLERKNELFWHGSRTENWWSIISNGLMIRPSNAVYTGSMFGDGLYFANKAQKSLGYTSLSSSYWARGNDDVGYLALYTVRVGRQYNIHNHTSECYSLNLSKITNKGYDSVYAHAGAGLRNDEFIVYNPAQCTIKYLVEVGR